MKKTAALILVALMIITVFPLSAAAEGEDPNEILVDPSFDLNSVDEGVLSNWYASDVYVPDEALRRALQNAAKVSELTVEAMFSLPTTLDLSGLGIRDLTGLEYAINVTELDISGNSVTSLYPISHLYNLKKLDYSSNQVEAVPAWIFTARSLTSVNGSSNGSTYVEAFGSSTNMLQTLYLENNRLSALPDMSAIWSLETLSLAGNAFTEFPQAVLGMTNLRILSLSNNALESCPDLSPLRMLGTLYLDTNRLTEFPAGLEDLPDLTDVYLYSNQITSISEDFMTSQSVMSLYLYYNSIQVLPDALALMPSLKNLDVSFNMITTERNATVISALADKLSAFHHSFQLPVLLVSVYPGETDGARSVIRWTPIEDFTNDEGSYSVVRYVVERKIDDIASPDALIVPAETPGGEGEGTEGAQETAPAETAPETPQDASGGEAASGEEGEETSSGEVIVLDNEYEVIGECEPTESSFEDTTGLEDVHYIYRVTAYVNCEYRQADPVLYNVSTEISTTETVSDISGKYLYLYIAGVVLIAALMAAVIIYISRTRKKPVKRKDIIDKKREDMRERHSRLRKVDLSEDVSKAWVEQDGLEDEIDKILFSGDKESAPEEKKEHNPVGEVFEEARKERRAASKRRKK